MPNTLENRRNKFFIDAKLYHKNYYDYTKSIYVRAIDKILITCPEHGDFEQTPTVHLRSGCKKCSFIATGNSFRSDTEKFIQKAKSLHGEKYIYNLVKYKRNNKKVKIICKDHGVFEQTPANHLLCKGCLTCSRAKKAKSQTYNTTIFIQKAESIQKIKYDYTLTNYKDNKTAIEIICFKHGSFKQTPATHLRGAGCVKCSGEKASIKYTQPFEYYKERIKIAHKGKYSYIEKSYINSSRKMDIICPIHGKFSQTLVNHIKGHGCRKCGSKNILENKLLKALRLYFKDEIITAQAKPEFLRLNKNSKVSQSFDIFLPEYKIAIEYQGEQHFKPVKYFGGIKIFNAGLIRDERKRLTCIEHSCNLLYFTYIEKHIPDNYLHAVYFKEEELMNRIKELIDEKNRCNNR